MKFLSVCSGIEAASVAWEPLGWKPLAFSEIDKFPSAVLAHHWPDVPNLGDLTNHAKWPNTLRPELIIGGTPCQAFSVAGLRKGLDDPRGNLSLVFLSLLEQYRPRWVVWENVPGVLSDKTGAFGALLGGLGQLGYGFAYRILDAQFFGVPQRRRRVFVVGCLGDWKRAAAVLFEPESLRGDSPPSREEGQNPAGFTQSGFECGPQGGRFTNTSPTLDTRCKDGPIRNQLGAGVIESAKSQVAPTLDARMNEKIGSNQWVDNGFAIMSSGQANAEVRTDGGAPSLTCLHEAPIVSHTLRGQGFDPSEDGAGRGTPLVPMAIQAGALKPNPNHGPDGVGVRTDGQAFTLEARAEVQAVAFAENSRSEVRLEGGDGQRTGAISTGGGKPGQGVPMVAASAVRRLTPTECERLQGFPDGHTLIPWRGKAPEACPDGPRYKALGNSMAVPVIHWIGKRIQELETKLPTK